MTRNALASHCALALTGCPGPQPCNSAPAGRAVPPPGGAGVIQVFGDSTPIDMSFSVGTSSCADAVNPEGATVEVLGPTNRDVAHALTFRPSQSPGGAATAQVTFTPAMPGYYHVTAAAVGSEPGEAQFRLGLPPRPVVTKTAHPKTKKQQVD